MNSQQYLDAIKVKTSTFSDNAIGKRLGLTRAFISKIRNGDSGFGYDTAIKVAQILEIHPATVMADCSLDRAKSAEERLVWREISARFSALKSSTLLSN